MADTPIYLDNASTTRIDPEVLAAMEPWLRDGYGNSASKYYELGRRANAAVEDAREKVAALAGAAPEEIVFTGGATEADNAAIQSALVWGRADKRHAVTSAVEHHAILEPLDFLAKHGGATVDKIGVDVLGRVDPAAVAAAVRADTALVTVMFANNEVGTVNDVAAIVAAVRKAPGGAEAFLHTDAVQAAGKTPLDAAALGVDALSLSAHKIHGPKGVGALYVRKGAAFRPMTHGGNQERGRRPGTVNVAGVVGFGAAAERARAAALDTAEHARQHALVERLWTALSASLPKIRRNGDPDGRIPGLLSICVEGAEGEAILGYLDMLHAIQVSSGSACTSGSLDPSHVLLAMGVPVEIAHGSVRFSLSHWTTAPDIDRVASAVIDTVERVRSMSVTWNG